MTKLNKVVQRRQKRLGHGYGSGKGGHTSSRGQKGQKARGSMNILFEGMKVKKSLLHRLPFKRGKDKFKGSPKVVAVKLDRLEVLPAGTKVTVAILVEKAIVGKEALGLGVKVLGGKITKKLTVLVPASASAKKEIEKAGGSVVLKDTQDAKS